MNILKRPPSAQQNLRHALETCNRLRRELAEMTSERDALRDQLEGDLPRATAWLQSKVWRQRRALDRLERKNLNVRFALRIMNRLREPVSAEEWKLARDADRLRDRIDEEAPPG